MTVLVGAGRCRQTPSGVKRTPSASSASIARQSIWYCAGTTLSLEISQVRRTSRDRPDRAARSSRVQPTKQRAARNWFPGNFGIAIVMFSIKAIRFFNRTFVYRDIGHLLDTQRFDVDFTGELAMTAALHQRHRGRTVGDGEQRIPAGDAEHHFVAALVGHRNARHSGLQLEQ